MNRPPRNAKTDRLVSRTLLSYAYLIAGMINIGFCLLNYFLVFLHYNVELSFLIKASGK